MGQRPIPVKNKHATETRNRTRNKSSSQERMDHQRDGIRTEIGESRKETKDSIPSLIGMKQNTKIASWNVRTLYQVGKTHQLTRELERYDIDICGVSECRWVKSGKTRLASGHTIIYSGCEEDHVKGVGIVMYKKAAKSLCEWKPINERIIVATFSSKHLKTSIIQCYAPTNDAQDEDKNIFYEQLQAVKEKIPRHNMCILMGDFNAKVGTDNTNFERTMGRHGLGDRNDNGERLVGFCSENSLVITGTIFKHKEIHKSTWTSPDGNVNNQIDHIMINGKYRRSILDTKAARGADISSDHQLVISKIRLKLRANRKNAENVRKAYEVKQLQVKQHKDEFTLEIRNRFAALENEAEEQSIDSYWNSVKEVYNQTAERILGIKRKRAKDWISIETLNKIEERRKLKHKLNSTKSPRLIENTKEAYRALDKEIKKACRSDKREHINLQIKDAETAAQRGEQGTLYKITKNISGKFKNVNGVIRDRNGNIITKDSEKQKRWEEHFSEVLNREPPRRLARIEKGRANENINTEEIDESEIVRAMKRLKNNKAPGIDNISSEMLKADPTTSVKWLKTLFDKIWQENYTPREWSKGILTTIPKKGDPTVCSNWRGITLLSVPSKVLGHIIIDRIKVGIDKELRQEQAGFRSGRRTTDQIFILRNIVEQSIEWHAPLYINFIDYEKAFDSLHRETLWKIMELYGIPAKLIGIIRNLYQNNQICIVNSNLQTDWVRIISGVKQGCCMSGFMFLIVMDWVMKNSVEGKNTGIRWKFTSKLEDLDFADDIALISSRLNDIQNKTTAVKDWAEKTGLKINIGKSKILRINTKNNTPIKIEQQEIEDVDEFTYLGSKINKEGGTTEDIDTRLQKARQAFIALNQVWKSNIYSRKTKVKLFKSNVISVLLYGSECWKLTKTDLKKLETFQTRCLRRIMKIFWPNKITNENLRETTGTTAIEKMIKSKRWRYIGHILRKDNNENEKIALTWAPEGRRKRGRPKETWRRTTEKERNDMGWPSWRSVEKEAMDRTKWRDLCLALCSTRSEEDR